MSCHRFVKANATILTNEHGLSPETNAVCAECGPCQMHFEGFMLVGND